jgi:hypothetical protein
VSYQGFFFRNQIICFRSASAVVDIFDKCGIQILSKVHNESVDPMLFHVIKGMIIPDWNHSPY